MVVVGHQAVRMTEPVEAIANLMNKLEEYNPTCVIEKDTLSFIPTPSDVIDSTRIFDPQSSGHERSLAETSVVLQDLTPEIPTLNRVRLMAPGLRLGFP